MWECILTAESVELRCRCFHMSVMQLQESVGIGRHRNKWLLDQLVFFWGVLKHICAAGPGGGMNKFNIKKLRSEGRATQTAANLMLNKAKGGGAADCSRSPCLGFRDLAEYLQRFVAVVLKIYKAEVKKKKQSQIISVFKSDKRSDGVG